MKINRLTVYLVIAVMLMTMLTGCRGSVGGNDGRLNIVCTIFPQYDWVREIVGNTEDVELSLLVDNGVDLHSFQPTAADLVTISECDIFIYVGGESDAWVDDALTQTPNPNRIVINMMDVLGNSVKEEEIVEGMDGHAEEAHIAEEDTEYDEHIWLSLKNAVKLCEAITEALSEADKENKSVYECNLQEYTESLNALDLSYRQAVDAAKYDTVLFGGRFPFRYMVNDYGINYYAAFAGCSAESEASFETVTFLAGKLNELDLPVVLVSEGDDSSLADTIISSADRKDQTVLVMNSMQSVTEKDINAGKTYMGIMQDNLEVLKQALGSSM